MQDLVRALLKVVDGIAEVVALGVVNVDDVLASGDGQSILIDAVVVVAVDGDNLGSTRDRRFEGHTILNLLIMQDLVRVLLKVVDLVAEVVALGVVNVDDILAGANGQGFLIGAVVVVAVNGNRFISTRDHCFESLIAYGLRLAQNLVRIFLKVVDRIAQISALGRLHSNRNVRCNVILCSISVRLLVEARYSFRIIAGFYLHGSDLIAVGGRESHSLGTPIVVHSLRTFRNRTAIVDRAGHRVLLRGGDGVGGLFAIAIHRDRVNKTIFGHVRVFHRVGDGVANAPASCNCIAPLIIA